MIKVLHPDILKAHERTLEQTKKISDNSSEYTKAPPEMRGAAARAERTLGKAIRRHHPDATLEDTIEIRRALQEHEIPYWEGKDHS